MGGHPERTYHVRRQGRLHLPGLVAVEEVQANAVSPPEIECERRTPESLLAFEGEHEPGPTHEVPRAGFGHERIDALMCPV